MLEKLVDIENHPENIDHQSQILVILKDKVDYFDMQIANICSLKNIETIRSHYSNITDESGAFNIPKMWGLKKKLNLESNSVPSAKKDKAGNLITSKSGILDLYRNTYIERLSHKEMLPQYESLKTI